MQGAKYPTLAGVLKKIGMGAKYPIYDGLLNIVHWQGNKICNIGNVGKYLIFAGEQNIPPWQGSVWNTWRLQLWAAGLLARGTQHLQN